MNGVVGRARALKHVDKTWFSAASAAYPDPVRWQVQMGSVAKVFAQIEGKALTPEEISERSSLSIRKVKKVLDFFEEFGFVKAVGPRVTATDGIMDLPEG